MAEERWLTPLRIREDGSVVPRAAPYREPVEIAHFSKTRANGTAYDTSQLKRYMRPSIPFDLSEGFETFRDRDRGDPHPANLAPIFESLRRAGGWNRADIDPQPMRCAPFMGPYAVNVLTWRGNFAKLLATPWNTRDAWHMA